MSDVSPALQANEMNGKNDNSGWRQSKIFPGPPLFDF